MNKKLKHALRRELKPVRVHPELKKRIMEEALYGEDDRKRRFVPMRVLAAAAALILVIGMTAALHQLLKETPDLRTDVLMPGEGEWVWIVPEDGLYHGREDCPDGENPRRVLLDEALRAGRTACGECLRTGDGAAASLPTENAGTQQTGAAPDENAGSGVSENAAPTVVPTAATLEPTPLGMEIPVPGENGGSGVSENAASTVASIAATPEPTPMNTYTPAPVETAMPTPAATVSPVPETESAGATVWITDEDRYAHLLADCRGMTGAEAVTAEKAANAGKCACPFCGEGVRAWMRTGGVYYHLAPGCCNLTDGTETTPVEAVGAGMRLCPVCAEQKIVWMKYSGGKYHADVNCPMADLFVGDEQEADFEVTENFAVSKTMLSCEDCCGDFVWMTNGGTYFHALRDCSGMSGALPVSVEYAYWNGKQPCPVCTDTEMVWIDPESRTYHAAQECGEVHLTQTALRQAVEWEYLPCEVCDGAVIVYATDGGKYYHHEEACSGMRGARSMTEETALGMGKAFCPKCMVPGGEAELTEDVLELRLLSDGSMVVCEASHDAEIEWIAGTLKMTAEIEGFFRESAAPFMTDEQLEEVIAKLYAGEIVGYTYCEYIADLNTALAEQHHVYCVQDGRYLRVERAVWPDMPETVQIGLSGVRHRVLYDPALGCCHDTVALRLGAEECVETGEGTYEARISRTETVYTPDEWTMTLEIPEPTESVVQVRVLDGAELVCTEIGGLRFMDVAYPTTEEYLETAESAGRGIVYADENGQYVHWFNPLSYIDGEASVYGRDNSLSWLVTGGRADAFFLPPEERMMWVTVNDRYYHAERHCSGMKATEYVCEYNMIEAGRLPCPVCMGES